jgi:hypothetical protein
LRLPCVYHQTGSHFSFNGDIEPGKYYLEMVAVSGTAVAAVGKVADKMLVSNGRIRSRLVGWLKGSGQPVFGFRLAAIFWRCPAAALPQFGTQRPTKIDTARMPP